LYPLLKYSYKLRFEERPNYDKMRFMIKSILLQKDFLPDNRFDWSLRDGENFKKFGPNDGN